MSKSCLAGPDHTRFRTLSYSTLRMLVESVSYLVHGQTEGAMAFLSPLDLYPFFSGAAYQTCSTSDLTQCNERPLMVKFPTGKWKGPAPLSWSQFLGAWLKFLRRASWFPLRAAVPSQSWWNQAGAPPHSQPPHFLLSILLLASEKRMYCLFKYLKCRTQTTLSYTHTI